MVNERKLLSNFLKNRNDKNKIKEFCKQNSIYNYTINDDMSIDIDTRVVITNKMHNIPIEINKVNGNFYMYNCGLGTFINFPKTVEGQLSVKNNKIKSFEYSSRSIGSYLSCVDNNIKSFKYFPEYLNGDLYCAGNPIYLIWSLFKNKEKIDLFNEFDIVRREGLIKPILILDRLNDFLDVIDKKIIEGNYLIDRLNSKYKVV